MTISIEPSTAADPQAERADLLAFLEAQRRSVLAIVEGLDEDAIRQAAVPSGWTPLGMIEHLAHAERFWFQEVVTGRVDALPWSPADGEGIEDELSVSARRPNRVLTFYRDQCARSNTVLTSISLTARPSGEVPADMSDEIHEVRTIVLHMIEETARHAGHLDIARELIDGRTGLGPR